MRRVARYLESQSGLAAACLFGSFARERARPDSDVDVAVLFVQGERDRMARFERCLEVETGLQDIVRRPVQVVDLEEAPPLLQRQVRQYGRLLLERDPKRRVALRSLRAAFSSKWKKCAVRVKRRFLPNWISRGVGGAGMVDREFLAGRTTLLLEYSADLEGGGYILG